MPLFLTEISVVEGPVLELEDCGVNDFYVIFFGYILNLE